MNYSNPSLRQRLAADYVLGTLRGPARRRFEQLAQSDQAVAAELAFWEQKLAPLDGMLPSLEPPQRVWRGISRRLPEMQTRPSARQLKPGMVERWRLLASAGIGALAASLAFMALPGPAPSNNQAIPVAVLADHPTQATLVASLAPGGENLTVRALQLPTVPAGRSLELWVVPRQGKPISLGLLGTDGSARPKLTAQMLRSAKLLAISLEQAGGSPTKQPQGPILYTGELTI